MAHFSYTVDTKPMADEMSSVSNSVTATTVAVVAMQAAVIRAEEKAAELVCDNVNRGFYTLIRSQISQKMAKLQSEVDSHFMQLVHQKTALLNIKKRMEKDYNMIAGRYIKTFNSLNANLKQRVFELDKPTIEIAVKEADKFNNRSKYLAGNVPITQIESLSLSQNIVASNIKSKGAKVIYSMQHFLGDMAEQKNLTDQILINDNRYTSDAKVYIPIAICESNESGIDSSIEVITSNEELDSYSKTAIKNIAFAELNKLEWSSNSKNQSDISSEVAKLISKSGKSKRVKELTEKLFKSNKFKTISKLKDELH